MEIDAAIRRAEIAERKAAEKEAVIEKQKNRIEELDRKANPQRYRLSSGAELIGHRFLGNNPYTVTLKIWTKVKEIEHTAVTYLSDRRQAIARLQQWRTNRTRVCQRLFQCCRASQRDTSQFTQCGH